MAQGNTPIPTPQQPLVDAQGRVTQPWLMFFQALADRGGFDTERLAQIEATYLRAD